jgi:hypothetical protein
MWHQLLNDVKASLEEFADPKRVGFFRKKKCIAMDYYLMLQGPQTI